MAVAYIILYTQITVILGSLTLIVMLAVVVVLNV